MTSVPHETHGPRSELSSNQELTDGAHKSEGDSTDQVGEQDLDGSERRLLETKSQTHHHRHSLRVVDGSIHKEDLPEIIPNNTTLTNRCTKETKKLG
jgi:hypothetical protein